MAAMSFPRGSPTRTLGEADLPEEVPILQEVLPSNQLRRSMMARLRSMRMGVATSGVCVRASASGP